MKIKWILSFFFFFFFLLQGFLSCVLVFPTLSKELLLLSEAGLEEGKDAFEKNNIVTLESIQKNMWHVLENNVHYFLLEKNRKLDSVERENLEEKKTKKEELDLELQNRQKHRRQDSVQIHIIKFNLNMFTFDVFLSSERGENQKTLLTWHESKQVISAINASMFLPDNLTSNGYLRKGEHVNNKRIASRLGGFFVANPIKETIENSTTHVTLDLEAKTGETEKWQSLPQAAILYKDETDFSRFTQDKNITFHDILEKYSIVIQNFRLLEIDNKPLEWGSDKRHSIAAIAEDKNGDILFLFAEIPLSVREFVQAIRDNSQLNLQRALYLEGGKHAGMTLSYADGVYNWFTKDSLLLMLMGQVLLPNIIGVKKK